MRLNTLSPGLGAKKGRKRVGRGIGCGFGKTAGRGHKGQKSRSGYARKIGFEGGQMPLQRRIPKSGFSSRVGRYVAEVCLSELAKVQTNVVDLKALQDSDVISANIKKAKIILSGEIKKAVTVKNLRVTAGARQAIEAAGGKVEE
ncbi:MAG: 50S ribosomal protein L15 [Gammaproteobacteria bacterium]|nr:50S ribosomal protein L15 [Gammaproteobacteria bacterium]